MEVAAAGDGSRDACDVASTIAVGPGTNHEVDLVAPKPERRSGTRLIGWDGHRTRLAREDHRDSTIRRRIRPLNPDRPAIGACRVNAEARREAEFDDEGVIPAAVIRVIAPGEVSRVRIARHQCIASAVHGDAVTLVIDASAEVGHPLELA